MENEAVSDSGAAEQRLSIGAWILLIMSAIGLWFPWAGFVYSLFKEGGFNRGIFTPGAMEFLGFVFATWIVTPLFTLFYLVYGIYSSPRNGRCECVFVTQVCIIILMWVALLATMARTR